MHLTSLTDLSYLSLAETQVTDAGLVHLKRLNNLSWLHVHGTHVTAAGIKELEQALPHLKISR